MNRKRFRKGWILVAVVSLAMGLIAPTAAAADPELDEGSPDAGST